ncbi:hypothetical protein CLU79DRAFT_839776 [Phycomyces nitens]|nr:hypothetical protein CLU79DRAFT_839776 [Phycomyces nitens]
MAVNPHVFDIEMAQVPREHVKDVLRAILHSICFHRLLINITPRELRVLETTVSTTDSPDVEILIEERVNEFVQSTSLSQTKQAKMAVLFYEKRLKKNWYQFSKSEELACWEQWSITLSIINPQTETERYKAQRSVSRNLSQCLLDVLKMANDYKEHIPSITTTEGNPFPYQMATPTKSETWNAMIKRLLVIDLPAETQRRGSMSSPTTQRSSSPTKDQGTLRMSLGHDL